MNKSLTYLIVVVLMIGLLFCFSLLPSCIDKGEYSESGEFIPVDTEVPTVDSYFVFLPLDNGASYSVCAAKQFDMPSRLVIPSSHDGKPVSALQSRAFKERNSINEVVIPETIKIIPLSAFYGCKALTSIYLPSSLEKMEYLAFYGCKQLSDVYYAGTKAQWKAIEDGGAIDTKVTIHCTDGDIAKN